MKKLNFLAKSNLRKFNKLSLWLKLGFALGITSTSAFASTTGTLPFVASLQTLADAISGPFMFSGAVILVAITALMSAFGEFGDGMRKLVNITFWLACGFGVVSLISNLFTTGAVF